MNSESRFFRTKVPQPQISSESTMNIDREYRPNVPQESHSSRLVTPDSTLHAGVQNRISCYTSCHEVSGIEILNGTLRDQTRNVLTQHTQRVRLVSGTQVFPGTSYFTQISCCENPWQSKCDFQCYKCITQNSQTLFTKHGLMV